jgi:hypothetical protein
MSSCLLITPEELKPYQAIGLTLNDVTRDWLENGVLRSPAAISRKEKARTEEVTSNYFEKMDEEGLFTSEAEVYDHKVAEGWNLKLSKALGVESVMVSRDQAKRIHAEKNVEYQNEDAFFADGTVYFVEGTLTPESVIHEFSHPLIKSLDASVRTKMYNDLMNDPELMGADILKQVNEEYNKDGKMSDERIQEEVLVRALTKLTNVEDKTPKILKWLNNFFYNIKQALRKVIGKKIKVEKMDGSTTLKGLADILSKGTNVELNKELITSSDLIEHFKAQQEFIDNFDKLSDTADSNSAVQDMINTVMKTAVEQKQDILNNPEFFSLQDVFVEEVGRQGLLNEIIDIIGEDAISNNTIVQEMMAKDNGQAVHTLEQIHERMGNLAHTLHKLSEVFDQLDNQLEDITDLDSKHKIDRLIYYKKFIQAWGETIDDFYEMAKYENADNPVKKLADKLNDKLTKITDKINDVQVAAVKDVFVELLEAPAANAKEKFEEELKRKKGSSQKVIDRLYGDFHNMTEAQYKRFMELKNKGNLGKEYKGLRQLWLGGLDFNADKAEAILRGEGRDSDYFNSMFESVSMTTDPAISSVYKHIQNLTAQYEADALDWYAGFIDVALPYVDKHKLQVQNRGSIGEKIGFRDVTFYTDKDGTVQKGEEWKLLNPWKDFSHDETLLKNKIQDAAKEFDDSPSDTNRKAWIQAKQEYQSWKNKYMHQNYNQEYYDSIDLLLKDDIGKDAQIAREEIFEELNRLEKENNSGQNDKLIDDLKLKLKKLAITTDEFGEPKTGRALEIAERLQEYTKARSEFFIEDEIPGAFEEAYNDYSDFIIDKHPIGSDSYKAEMEKWLRKNTRVSLKNSVYETRSALIEQKKALTEKLDAKNKEIFDDTELQRVLNEQSNIIKDNANQPNGSEATSEARKKVKEAHEEIEKRRQDTITRTGLSVKDEARMKTLKSEKYEEGSKRWLTRDAEKEYQGLIKKRNKNINELGLDTVTLAELSAISEQLAELTSYLPTDYYKESLTDLLVKEGLEQMFLDYTATTDYHNDDIYKADNESFSEFVASSKIHKAMDASPALKKWVEQNHYLRNNILTPTYIWSTSASSDPYNYRTKRLTDRNGKKQELIKIDGMYRIPNSTFFTRIVKDKYVTEKIVGETIDNRGKFLPKNEESNRYRNTAYYDLEQSDPEAFKLLKDVTKQYLKGQEALPFKDRLYLSYPKIEKTRLENIRTGNVLTFPRRVREFMHGREDDVLDLKTQSEIFKKDKRALSAYSLISTDVKMPVFGIYDTSNEGVKINIIDISTDILKTMPEYIASGKHKAGAMASNSYARMMQDIVNNTEVDNYDQNIRKLSRNSNQFNIPTQFSKKQGQSQRSKALNALVERDLDGIRLTGVGSKNKKLQKVLDAMVKRSSKINFNWNILSGAVNYGQIKVTSYTHALAGDEISLSHSIKGESWAHRASAKISRDVRRRGHKSLEEQQILIFDAITGRNIETLGDSLSRTYVGDVLEGKLPQNARKWMEMQGTVQNFAAMMYKKMVTITDKNGVSKQVPYIKAFELNEDGRIKTKDGIEAGYEITYDAEGNVQLGQKMIDQKLHMQNVIMKWNGAFSQKDAPLIGRFLLAKQFLFLKKHVIPIASKQYSFGGKIGAPVKRMNWTTGTAEYGHSIQTVRYLQDFISNLSVGKISAMTKSEKKGFLFTLMSLIIGYIALPMLRGVLTPTFRDEDDREKINFAKMNARSGWYDGGLFGKDGLGITADQDSYTFHIQGYILNMLSMMSTKLTDEYTSVQWGLHPDGFIDFTGQTTSQSISMSQTLKMAKDLVAMLRGDAPTSPSRNAGPYFFEQEGYEKGNYYRLLFRFFGLNDKILHPTGTQQSYESGQRMK